MKPFSYRCARIIALVAAIAVIAGCSAAINPQSVEAARTAARVKTALVNDPVLGTRVIDVRMTGTVVRLSGTVRSQEEATRAAEVARAVAGVSSVDSQLQIASEPPLNAEPVTSPADPARGAAYEFAELQKSPGGALALGAGVGWAPADDRLSLAPLIRFGSGTGLRPAVAFPWYETTDGGSGIEDRDAGGLRLRPMMAGLRYSLPLGRVSVAPSLVAGYAFNSVRVPDDGSADGLPVAVNNSFVWGSGVSVWVASGRRTAVNLSIARLITSPRVTTIENGQLRTRSQSADATLLVVGLAYTLF
jgi:hypothetical protein